MLTVRRAESRDLDGLCRVRDTKQLFEKYLAECDGERAHFLVAEIDGQIVGFGLVYLAVTIGGKAKSRLPKLSDLYVQEGYRHRGVGEELVRAREALARSYGHSQIYVSIDPNESAAMIALATKLGYRALQDKPYPVTAIFHDADGRSYQKHYERLDFAKPLI